MQPDAWQLPLSPADLQCTPYKAVVMRKWANDGLRKGLGLLGSRLAAGEDDVGCGPVSSSDGRRYVLTPFGSSLWHRIMHHMLGSEEAAARLPAYLTVQEPAERGATAAWRQGATLLSAA